MQQSCLFWVFFCYQEYLVKTQKFRPKTKNGKNLAQKPVLRFSIIKAASPASFSLTLHFLNFYDEMHLKLYL